MSDPRVIVLKEAMRGAYSGVCANVYAPMALDPKQARAMALELLQAADEVERKIYGGESTREVSESTTDIRHEVVNLYREE